MGKKNLIAIGVLFVVLLGAIFVTLYLVSSSQDTRSSANTPDVFPTVPPFVPNVPVEAQGGDSETADPGPVDGVSVNHPYINGDDVDYTQASCTWDPNPNAVQYSLTITEIDTGTVIKDEAISNEITEDVFVPVSGNTYRCEVAAINASGVVGIAGVDEQVCEIPVEVEEPSPTPIITTPPVVASPSATPVVEIPTATPTLPPAGSIGTIATVGIGGIVLLLIGGALLFL